MSAALVGNAFQGLPRYSLQDSQNELAAREIAVGIRKIPGYTGHVCGSSQLCGTTFANVTSALAQNVETRYDRKSDATLNLNNQTERAQQEGYFEDELGKRREAMPRNVGKIIVGYTGHKPELRRVAGSTFGSYVLKEYGPRSRIMQRTYEKEMARTEEIGATLNKAETAVSSETGSSRRNRMAATARARSQSPKSTTVTLRGGSNDPNTITESQVIATSSPGEQEESEEHQPARYTKDIKYYVPGTVYFVPGKHDHVGLRASTATRQLMSEGRMKHVEPVTDARGKKFVDWYRLDKNWCGHKPEFLPEYDC